MLPHCHHILYGLSVTLLGWSGYILVVVLEGLQGINIRATDWLQHCHAGFLNKGDQAVAPGYGKGGNVVAIVKGLHGSVTSNQG